MGPRHDILDEREPWGKPLLASIAFHAAVFATLAVYALLPLSETVQWGDPNAMGGGAVSITPVSKIPLPARSGRVNPVANDTESRVPAPPPQVKPQPRRAEPEDEMADAVVLKGRQAAKQRAPRRRRANPSRASVPRENQLYGSSGAAATTPMFGRTGGGAGVGLGEGNPFGRRFGAYAAVLRQRVAQAWDTSRVDPRVQSAPMVIVTFEILRDGSVRNLRFLQRSGIPTLDYSCQRAILDAAPFPPLPRGFERDVARIEFWFQLQR